MKRLSSLMLCCCALACCIFLLPTTPLSAQVSCNDLFFDSGGNLGDYSNNERDTIIICPGSNTQNATLLFNRISLAEGDTLWIYDGNSTNWPLAAEFDGAGLYLSTTLKASTASGCFTVVFHSDTAQTSLGWSAQVLCGTPSICFGPIGASTLSIKPNAGRLTWAAMFGADYYGIQIGEAPFLPGGTTVVNDTTSTTLFSFSGLTEGTFYDAYIRTYCTSGDSSTWTHVPFFTLPEYINVPTLSCGGAFLNISSIGTGVYNLPVCGIPTPGREKIVRFHAPNTRTYRFGVSQVMNSEYVGYFYKPVSEGISAAGWTCIEDFNQPDTVSFGPLTAGRDYFIRFEAQNPLVLTQQRFGILDCEPTNDEAVDAIYLGVDVPCSGNIFANEGAKTVPGEPDPDADPTDGVPGRWLNTINRTVWFRFIAPFSGTVTITTDVVPQGSNYDTQVALYQATDPADYTTFSLLESDEDNGDAGLGYNAQMSYTGLTPGHVYYIQMDGYGITDGSFCLEVLDKAPRSTDSNCTPAGYSVANVNGLVPGGNRWYNIYATPDILEIGDLVAAIKPGEQDLGTVSCRLNVTDTIPVAQNETPYMPAYYNFSSTNPVTQPVTLRLFYYNSEFDKLKIKTQLPAATIQDLNITNYKGPDEDCNQLNNNFTTGSALLYTDIIAEQMGVSGTFYLEFQLPSLGEIAAHLDINALPLELKSFTGKVSPNFNVLIWETYTEKNVREHRVERSNDGISWTVIGQKPGAGTSNVMHHYELEDRTPLPTAYYRLRSIDYDGTEAVSHLIRLVRPNGHLTVSGLYPTPTSNVLTVNYLAENEQVTSLRIVDFTGKIVQETILEPVKGANTTTLPLHTLPAGVYLLYLSNSSETTLPMRIVKQ